MKLFIYDKFWDALLKLNKGTQGKVTEFISKFRDNSKSAAINLEAIKTFKDQSIKTARIDQKYRAIIKEVTPGELYLLIWVDNHDEAMDWAKNKIIDWNDQTQAYQVFSIDETVAAIADASVDIAADLFMKSYDSEQMFKIGVPEILIPSVLKITDLAGLEKLEEYLPVDVFENLFYLLDGANIEHLMTEIQEGLNNKEAIASKNNSRSFIELTDDEILNEALQGSLQKWKYYLHPSQSTFVHGDFKGSIKLSGGAGTGKTVAALHRLKFLSQNKNLDKPILFTTFTKELSENLKALANDLQIAPTAFEINNIDALAFGLAKEYKLILSSDKVFGLGAVKKPQEVWEQTLEELLSPFDADFLQSEFEQVVLLQNIKNQAEYLKASRVGRGKPITKKQRVDAWAVIESFLKNKQESHLFYKEEIFNLVSSYLKEHEIHPYSHVIVDELQDFSNVELNFIRSLCPESANDLFLVGDPLQNIYNKKINFSKAGINIRGNRSKRLRINYRTTEEIKNLALSIVNDEDYDNFDGEAESKKGYLSLFHGDQPEYRTYKSKDDELTEILEDVKTILINGFHYNDIAIAARTRDSVNDFRNYLHKNNIPYVDKHLLNSKNEGVRLTTFHGLKGLEFKQVYLVDVNERTLPLKPTGFANLTEPEQEQIIKTEKALFYVACSRAVQRVMITGVGTRSSLVKTSVLHNA